jgi:SAM-dependent methyltransferase
MDHAYEKFKKYLSLSHSSVYHEPETPNFHNVLIDQFSEEFIQPLNLDLHAKILDIGCGSGYWLNKMKDLGYTDLTGITLNDEDIAVCNSKQLNVLKSDFSFIDLPSSSVDFIWCRQTLEHSVFPLFTLFEFNRLLQTNAQAYIEVPAPDTDRKHEENPNHFSILGEKMWTQLFSKAGFDVEWSKSWNGELSTVIDSITLVQKEKFFIFLLKKAKSYA